MTECKKHPDAPHGFCRNESISQDRYVCECEFWDEPSTEEDAFDSWWNGLEGFHLLSERCLSDIQHHSGTIHPERLTTWMKVCWNAALEAAEDYNAVDVSKLKAKFS